MRPSTQNPIPELFQFLNAVEKIWTPYSAANRAKVGNYPPYNISQQGDDYVVEVACAGFAKSELSVTQESNILKITGEAPQPDDIVDNGDVKFIHKGLARRDFTISLQVPVSTAVTGVTYADGILVVRLKTTPDENVIKHPIQDPAPPKARTNLKS